MVDLKKAKALIAELQEKTESQKINWEPTANQDEFVATFKGTVTFTVSKYENPNTYDDSFKLVMRDREGREMLSFTDRGAMGAEISLRSLYEAAHDSALKVDETIDSILENLRQAQ